ncbi:MAG: SBBP repeat-containing protein [Phycisphaerales bacterium]
MTSAAAFFFCAVPLLAQTAYCESIWAHKVVTGDPKPEPTRFAFHADSTGDTYIGGNSQLAPALPAITIWKVDQSGGLAWTQSISNSAWADAKAVAVTKVDGVTGLVYVSGWVEGPSGKDILTAAVDEFSGAVIWQQTYNGPMSGDDVPVVVRARAQADGTQFVYVGGNSEGQSLTGASLGLDYVVIKYAGATGARPWGDSPPGVPIVARYNGPASGDDVLSDLAIEPNGGGGAGGVEPPPEGTGACCLPTGGCDHLDPVACANMGGTFQGLGVSCLSVDCPGARFYVTGTSVGVSTGKDYATVRFNDANPNDPLDPMRVARKEWSATDVATSLVVARQPGTSHGVPPPFAVFVTGYTNSGTDGTYDMLTLSYTPDLSAERWDSENGVGRYNGAGQKNDYARKIDYEPGWDTLYVAGETYRGGIHGIEAVLIKYFEIDGSLPWGLPPDAAVRYFPGFEITGSGEDTASDLVIDKNNNAYIAGKTWNGTSFDIFAVSYDGFTSGRRWVEIIRDGQGNPIVTGRDYITHNGGANGFDVGVGIRVYFANDFNHCFPVGVFGLATEVNAVEQKVLRYAAWRINQCDVDGGCGPCP